MHPDFSKLKRIIVGEIQWIDIIKEKGIQDKREFLKVGIMKAESHAIPLRRNVGNIINVAA